MISVPQHPPPPKKKKKAKVRDDKHLFEIKNNYSGSTDSCRNPNRVLIRGKDEGILWEREGE